MLFRSPVQRTRPPRVTAPDPTPHPPHVVPHLARQLVRSSSPVTAHCVPLRITTPPPVGGACVIGSACVRRSVQIVAADRSRADGALNHTIAAAAAAVPCHALPMQPRQFGCSCLRCRQVSVVPPDVYFFATAIHAACRHYCVSCAHLLASYLRVIESVKPEPARRGRGSASRIGPPQLSHRATAPVGTN